MTNTSESDEDAPRVPVVCPDCETTSRVPCRSSPPTPSTDTTSSSTTATMSPQSIPTSPIRSRIWPRPTSDSSRTTDHGFLRLEWGRTGERSRHSTSSSVSNRPRVSHAGCRRGIIDQRDDIKPQYERAKFRRDPACGYISPVLTVSSVRRFILSYSTLSTIWNPRTHLEIVTTAVLPWN